jgi:hypothetical protein
MRNPITNVFYAPRTNRLYVTRRGGIERIYHPRPWWLTKLANALHKAEGYTIGYYEGWSWWRGVQDDA